MAKLREDEIEEVLNATDSSEIETVDSDESEFVCDDNDEELENNSSSNENNDGPANGTGGDANVINILNFTAPNEFVGDVGPVHSLETGSNELSYFEFMLGGDGVYNDISKYTHLYAAFKQNLCKKEDKNWEDTSPEEIKAYIV